MAYESDHKKNKKEHRKIERLRRLLGIDLCACGGSHKLCCKGICRKSHTNPNTRTVECPEMYRIDHSVVKSGGPRKPKRTWRYGNQKEESDNRQSKQRRRERFERERSE